VWLVAKHYSPAMLRSYGWQIALGQLLWGAIAFRHGGGLAYLRGKFEGVSGFSAMRSKHLFSNALFLENSEEELYQLQKRIGFDLYWRLYFALT
jgi:hypothetical protein